LIACEESATVRVAFSKLGYEAWSCDIQDSRVPGDHYKGDVLDVLNEGWDLMIAHPPCTFLTVTANRWLTDPRYPTRKEDRELAAEFFMKLYEANIPHIAVENPVGYMSTYFRKPDQIIQPWQFGDEASKKTCLWLKNLPPLVPTNIVDKGPRVVTDKGKSLPAWYNASKGKERSKTFTGIANAMADQWGNYVNENLKKNI
jgi:hypothetical protein